LTKPTLVIAGLLALAAAGCAARMKLDPALAEATEGYPVTGANPRVWGTPVAFGPWRASAVKEGAGVGWSFEVLGLGRAVGSRRPWALRLEGAAGALELECLQQQLVAVAPFGVTLVPIDDPNRPVLACGLRPLGAADGGAAWTLALRTTGRPAPAFEGELRNERGVLFTVRSVHALRGGGGLPLGRPAGYTFERNGAQAAAVEIIDAGRVLIPLRETDAMVLAAASAALLLFQPPD
jgi:hypothetical protein